MAIKDAVKNLGKSNPSGKRNVLDIVGLISFVGMIAFVILLMLGYFSYINVSILDLWEIFAFMLIFAFTNRFLFLIPIVFFVGYTVGTWELAFAFLKMFFVGSIFALILTVGASKLKGRRVISLPSLNFRKK